MKPFFILGFFLLSISLQAKENDQCFPMRQYGYNILQRLDAHHYEIARGVEYHMILQTKKAVFEKPGIPWGIKIKPSNHMTIVQLKNGFTSRIAMMEECGSEPLPETCLYGAVTCRQLYKGEKAPVHY